MKSRLANAGIVLAVTVVVAGLGWLVSVGLYELGLWPLGALVRLGVWGVAIWGLYWIIRHLIKSPEDRLLDDFERYRQNNP